MSRPRQYHHMTIRSVFYLDQPRNDPQPCRQPLVPAGQGPRVGPLVSQKQGSGQKEKMCQPRQQLPINGRGKSSLQRTVARIWRVARVFHWTNQALACASRQPPARDNQQPLVHSFPGAVSCSKSSRWIRAASPWQLCVERVFSCCSWLQVASLTAVLLSRAAEDRGWRFQPHAWPVHDRLLCHPEQTPHIILAARRHSSVTRPWS